MSMASIRKQYGVPAKRGTRVCYSGESGHVHEGVIVGSRGAYLRIRFSTLYDGRTGDFHPTWQLRYLPALGE